MSIEHGIHNSQAEYELALHKHYGLRKDIVFCFVFGLFVIQSAILIYVLNVAGACP